MLLIIITIFLCALTLFLIYKPKYKKEPQSFSLKRTKEVAPTAKSLSTLLRENTLFAFLTPAAVDALAGCAERVVYAKGEEVVGLCLLLEGVMQVTYNSRVIGTKEKGSLCMGVVEMQVGTGVAKRHAVTDLEVLQVRDPRQAYVFYSALKKTNFTVFTLYFKQSIAQAECANNAVLKEMPYNRENVWEHLDRVFRLRKKEVQVRKIAKGQQVLRDEKMECILFVMEGRLSVDGCVLEKGRYFGYFGVFFPFMRFNAKAEEDSTVAFLSTGEGSVGASFDVKRVLELPVLFMLIDSACEWVRLHPGEVLVKKHSRAEHAYFIETGRLAALEGVALEGVASEGVALEGAASEGAASEGAAVEYTTGMSVGDKECLTGAQWEHTLIATKITDVARIPSQLIHYVLNEQPGFYAEFTNKLFSSQRKKACKVVTVIPSSDEAEALSFAMRLKNTLGGSCLFLNNKSIAHTLQKNAFDELGELRFMNYVSLQEEKYPLILIFIENAYSRLFKCLLAFSDTLLVVGRKSGSPLVPFLDPFVFEGTHFCRIEGVLLYEERRKKNAKEELYGVLKRGGRLHAESGLKAVLKEAYAAIKAQMSSNRVMEGAGLSIHHILSPSKSGLPGNTFCNRDFERLARTLLGKRIGLVLGGGGARGLAHIGVIQALEEEGIPIDCIGGTSMGAFIGGLYARECDNIRVFKEAKQFCRKMSSKWRQILDLTYPICSFFTGDTFNRVLFSIFNTEYIQNLWIEYFCITTNITAFEEMVHRRGSLWRYVRASMSLSGYLPPLCDNKNLLMDGGYMNNVPADVMLGMGVERIIAVDVGSTVVNDYEDFGDSLNGFYVLFQRFFRRKKFLTMNEIQYRLAYVSSQKKMKELCNNPKIILLRPEIDKYETMHFNRFEEIVACGYEYGKKVIKEWKKNGLYAQYFGDTVFKKTRRRYSI